MLRVAISTGILANNNNSLQDRFSHQIGRKSSAYRSKNAAAEVINEHDDLQRQIKEATEQSKAINASKKALQEKLKNIRAAAKGKEKARVALAPPTSKLSIIYHWSISDRSIFNIRFSLDFQPYSYWYIQLCTGL